MLDRRDFFALGAAAAAVATLPPARARAASGLAVAAQSRTVGIRGDAVACRRFGSGRPLLFLQRFRGGMDDWGPMLLDAFAATREVVLFDSLGVSESLNTRWTIQPTCSSPTHQRAGPQVPPRPPGFRHAARPDRRAPLPYGASSVTPCLWRGWSHRGSCRHSSGQPDAGADAMTTSPIPRPPWPPRDPATVVATTVSLPPPPWSLVRQS